MVALLLALCLAAPANAGDQEAGTAVVIVQPDLLAEYDAIRVALSQDRLSDAATAARALSTASGALATTLAANAIAAATDLAHARTAFSDLSAALIVALNAAPDRPKVFVYHCPMWSGYGWWVQLKAGLVNPYMGQAMPGCGEEMSLKAAAKAATSPCPSGAPCSPSP